MQTKVWGRLNSGKEAALYWWEHLKNRAKLSINFAVWVFSQKSNYDLKRHMTAEGLASGGGLLSVATRDLGLLVLQ